MAKVVLGFAPTRRSIFSAPDAIKYANLTRDRLTELGVEFVDITDINEEGLLYDDNDRVKVAEKFKAAGSTDCFCPTVILERNMWWQDWQGNCRFRCSCGVPGTSVRMKMESASETASADYLPQAKSCGASRYRLHISRTAG